MIASVMDSARKRRLVMCALEVTVEGLRERIAQAMINERVLDQLYAAIQPDGTLHL